MNFASDLVRDEKSRKRTFLKVCRINSPKKFLHRTHAIGNFKRGTYRHRQSDKMRERGRVREGRSFIVFGETRNPSYDVLINVVRRSLNVGSDMPAMGRGDHFLFVRTASWCVEEHSATSFYTKQ